MDDFEKLGAFYLGKKYDTENNNLTDEIVLYDSKDLTTHAVCIGMTGSGKTGLCISLLEEAAIDNIPAIIIDPKGDMGNMLLTFPGLSKKEFLPWINEREGRKKGLSKEEFAAQQAKLWRDGLAKWGQTKDRIKMLREKVELNIYTPGSNAGIPVSILDSLSLEDANLVSDKDVMLDRIESVVSSLLGLLGSDTDPLTSREHILLSTIFNHYWNEDKKLDLALLIQAIQNPPFDKLGVFDLSTFFPQKDRFKLAMMINNLLASPSFQTWLQGEPLNVNNFLYTKTGKPKLSIFHISHLSDSERMLFVSLLLNQVIGWMRSQAGTSSLRAILYFDEIFGYLPPVGNPVSKKPLLTLLKQARAYGLGIVLATQNPVDVDYKALSNTGTWLIGRLQTRQDRERLMDGLMSSSTTTKLNRKKVTELISGLGKRKFLLHNVHEDEPVVFNTRWALSYLSGPLTKNQIKILSSRFIETGKTAQLTKAEKQLKADLIPPVLPENIKQYFIPYRGNIPLGDSILFYKPFIWGSVSVLFTDQRKKIDKQCRLNLITPILRGTVPVDWLKAEQIDINEDELMNNPDSGSKFSKLPEPAVKSKYYSVWEKQFKDYVYRNQKLTLQKSPSLKVFSNPDETERDFRIRLGQIAREHRDEWIEKLREKYSKKILSIESKIRTVQQRVQRETEQAKQQKLQTAISFGTTLLGALFGRKTLSKTTISKAGTVLRGAGRTMKESSDIKRAEQTLEYLKNQMNDLEAKFQEEVLKYSDDFDVSLEEFETVSIYPKKTNINVKYFGLVWAPFWSNPDGTSIKAWV
ncbi:ATP-binding protein [Bacteroidota bacterium]